MWLTRCRILEFRSPSWPIRPLHEQSFTGESTLNTVDSSTVLEHENLELACTDRGSKSTSTGIDAIGPCSTQGTGSSQSIDCCQTATSGSSGKRRKRMSHPRRLEPLGPKPDACLNCNDVNSRNPRPFNPGFASTSRSPGPRETEQTQKPTGLTHRTRATDSRRQHRCWGRAAAF